MTAILRPVCFELVTQLIPKANKHKVARRGGGFNAKRMVVNDLTGVLAKSEEDLAERALNQVPPGLRGQLPWSCPIEAHVTICYPLPKSCPRWKREAALAEDPDGRFHMQKTPDLENVLKFVWDALEGVIYDNDKRIWRQVLEKRYGPDEEERVFVALVPRLQATARAHALPDYRETDGLIHFLRGRFHAIGAP